MVAVFSQAGVIWLALLWGADSPERTWTSADGRQIQARLIRQTADSVTLLRNGQEFNLPLTRLSPADQQYLRDLAAGKIVAPPAAVDNPFATPEEKAAAAQPENPFATPEEKAAGTNPPVSPPSAAAQPAAPPATDTPPASTPGPALPLGKTRKPPAQDRVWTDRFGKTVTARFVRMNGAVVLLMRGPKPQPIPFNLLSEADQQHLRQFLEERGMGNQLPSPGVDPATGLAGNPPAPAPVPPPVGVPSEVAAPAIPPLPASAAEAFARLQEESQRRMDEARQRAEAARAEQDRLQAELQAKREADAAARESQRQADEQARLAREAEQRANAATSPTLPSPPAAVPGPPGVAPGPPNLPSPPTFSPPPPPSFTPPSVLDEVKVYTCSNCNKEVSEADKKCPHCGTFFLYTEDADTGRRSSNRSSKSSAVVGGILCLGFAATLLIGVPVAFILLLVKVFSKPSPPPQAPFAQRSYYG